jgi:hypothetical protein
VDGLAIGPSMLKLPAFKPGENDRTRVQPFIPGRLMLSSKIAATRQRPLSPRGAWRVLATNMRSGLYSPRGFPYAVTGIFFTGRLFYEKHTAQSRQTSLALFLRHHLRDLHFMHL